jgi:Amt family ammonium transporter
VAGFIGFSGFGIAGSLADAPGAGVLHPQISFLFQVAFAATAATIVSGAVAGRLKFFAYLVYTVIITGLVYPISGFWTWGGGWLAQMNFHDFAGSLIVHAVGGFAGLAGAIVLGARKGRFAKDGTPRAMPGHNISLSALGVFILLVGWFGFNPGSQVAIAGADNVHAVATVAVNTMLAAGAGGVIAMIMAWVFFGKPDLTMVLNGVLGGLVGITANCNIVSNESAILIGAIAGVLVFLGVKLLDKLRIDDPVGAWPVHGLCGVWGGLAAAIFGPADFTTQLIGSLAIAAWAFVTLFLVFFVLKKLGALRVSAEEETRGLDIGEHGMEAYPDFQGFLTK